MNVSWVLSDKVVLDPLADLSILKNIGSFWGSWKTWRACATDNVICYDMNQAQSLIKRQFQKQCNFYIPNSLYTLLGRPPNVKLYEGNFVHDVDSQEEIIAMHLLASTSDIVLLLGFDLEDRPKTPDKLIQHRFLNYQNLIKQVIANNPETQWVLVDHKGEIGKIFESLGNLTKDSMDNVIELLTNN